MFTSGSSRLTLKDVPTYKPGPGEVLLKLEASGVCHSDLHILQGSFPIPSNSVLGHEITGTVVAYGLGVDPKTYPRASSTLPTAPILVARAENAAAARTTFATLRTALTMVLATRVATSSTRWPRSTTLSRCLMGLGLRLLP